MELARQFYESDDAMVKLVLDEMKSRGLNDAEIALDADMLQHPLFT